MTRGDKVRFGILSLAHYHANFWAAAARESPEAELVGIRDDRPARGTEAATKHNTIYYPDLNDLLARVDAVGITSETSRHAELVEAAAGAGRHILLEKPMARTLAECDRIRRAVHATGIIFVQNYPKRYDPVNRELKAMVDRGDLGQIALMRVRHGNSLLLELGDQARVAWYTNPALSGGGAD